MAYLPNHLCRHELLTATEREYLTDLDTPSRHSLAHYETLVTAVLASRVEGYHQEPNAPHWKPAALALYTAAAREGEGLSQDAVAHGAAWLRECHAPALALKLLIRIDALHLNWRRERALSMVTTADKLRAA